MLEILIFKLTTVLTNKVCGKGRAAREGAER
jgi:hypothetical protein